eukprot:TRINITY_DN1140_c0_g1_i2.p1 TRINITY_DN1140_c0_g1~~TRINITY_DN1140_c0_g1_i2.p1  ORF type:complete len:244 (-),score=55.25 TRINITY_DN1140_c0_g1_i2:55-786(-)
MFEEHVKSFLGPCHSVFFHDNNFLDAVCLKLLLAKLLGIAIITGAFGVKVPQILKIWRARSVEGLALLSTLLELVGYLITLSYNYRNGFPFTAYGEYVFITVQSLIILLLFRAYGKESASQKTLIVLYIVAFIAAAYVLISNPGGVASISLLATLQGATIPIFIASRVPQIWRNFADKSAGQLALLTYLLNFAGAVARIFTTIQEVDDPLMLVSCVVGALLNGIILFQILFYGNVDTNKKKTA